MSHSRFMALAISAAASLSILAGTVQAGSLSGVKTIVPNNGTGATAINLTTQGSTDWYNYAYNATAVTDHKSGGSGIGLFTVTAPTVNPAYTNPSNGANVFGNYGNADQSERVWTDGTAGAGLHTTGNGGTNTYPTAGFPFMTNGSRYGISGISYNSGYSDGSGVGSGYSFSVTATAATQVFTLYTGNSFATGVLTASLSDGTGVTFTDTNTNMGGTYVNNAYSFTFSDATPGTKLNVSWMETTRFGAYDNIGIEAATLAPAVVAPEPSSTAALSLGLLGLGALALKAKHRSSKRPA